MEKISWNVHQKVCGVSTAPSDNVVEGQLPTISCSGASSNFWASVRSTFPLDAVRMSFRDPSGVTFKVESILISSYLGLVGVRCPQGVEYYLGISSPGSLLVHSFFINAWTSSNATRLGVISEVCSWVDGIPAG